MGEGFVLCLRLYGGGGILPTSNETPGGVDDTPLLVGILGDNSMRGVNFDTRRVEMEPLGFV